jgi:hypothetical protein
LAAEISTAAETARRANSFEASAPPFPAKRRHETWIFDALTVLLRGSDTIMLVSNRVAGYTRFSTEKVESPEAVEKAAPRGD